MDMTLCIYIYFFTLWFLKANKGGYVHTAESALKSKIFSWLKDVGKNTC